MKKVLLILPLALILCFMVGCQDKEAMAELEEFRAQAELEEQNKELTKKVFEEIDKQNFDVIDEFFAEGYIAHFPPYPDSELEAFKQSLQETYSALPDYTHTIEDMAAKGDKVIVRLTNRGTDKASGIKIEFPVILMSKIADGKIIETWAMVDYLGQAQQLGFELKPKEGEK
jgi:ketosteroid isomerase-like protein